MGNFPSYRLPERLFFNEDERAAMFRFFLPNNENSFIATDAFDRGSFVKIIPEKNKP